MFFRGQYRPSERCPLSESAQRYLVWENAFNEMCETFR